MKVIQSQNQGKAKADMHNHKTIRQYLVHELTAYYYTSTQLDATEATTDGELSKWKKNSAFNDIS